MIYSAGGEEIRIIRAVDEKQIEYEYVLDGVRRIRDRIDLRANGGAKEIDEAIEKTKNNTVAE